MKKIFFPLSIIIAGCSNPAKVVPENTTGNLSTLLPDSTRFKFISKKIFTFNRDIKDGDPVNRDPDTLTHTQKNAWNYEGENHFNSLNGFFYGATFYSKQNRVNTISPIVIEGSSDDYNAYTLLCIDQNGKLISNIDLAGGLDGGPDSMFQVQEDSIIYFTHDKSSVFLDDSTFCINEVNYVDNVHGWTYTIDSISNIYRIEKSGEISLRKKDSIRVLKKEIYNY